MAAVSSACAVLPSEARGVVVRGQEGNATCSSGQRDGGVEYAMRSTKASRRRMASVRISAPVPLSACPTKRAVHNRALIVGTVLVTESWLGSEEGIISHAAAEKAIASALAAATAARDVVASYAGATVEENVEFPSEFDLLRLERARLSDMEQSCRADYDAESALLVAEQSYVHQLELLLGGVSSLVRDTPSTMDDADSMNAVMADGLPQIEARGVDITVRSKRKAERVRRRKRALEKAEKVATTLAAASPVPKSKKLQISSQDPSDPVHACLREIGKTKLLTALEEVALSRKIQDLLKLEKVKADLRRQVGREPTVGEWSRAVGMEQNAFELRVEEGRFAKEKMVNSNLRLVVSIAKNYQGRGMTFQDLIQEGSLGLMRGAEKFDPNKGFKFSTYAHWWIRQAITRSIADQSRTIRLPIHVYEVVSRINKAKKALVLEHGRQPLDEEVAELVGLSVEKLQTIVKSTRAPTSMERPIGEEKNTTVGELVPDIGVESPEDGIARQLRKQDVEGVLRTLSPREREVVRLRFGFDDGRSRTLEEIGNMFKVTRERIRQIEAKAMRKLRQPSRNSILLEYLDVKDA